MKAGKFFKAFIGPRRRLTLAAASVAAAAAGSIVALVFAVPGGDSDRAWSASGGEEVLTDAASGDLELTSIAASAFSTTVEARLRTAVVPDGSTVAIPRESVQLDPALPDLKLLNVRAVSRSEFALTFLAGPLPAAVREVTLSLSRYVVIPPSGDGQEVSGKWLARASISAGRPSATIVGGGQQVRIPIADGRTEFVIEEAAYDGYVLRLRYRVLGETDNLQMFQGSNSDPSVIPLPLLGAVPGGAATVEVRVATSGRAPTILLPSFVRTKSVPVVALLTKTATGFEGRTETPDGEMRLTAGVAEGEFRVVVVGPANGPGLSNRSVPISLVDEGGRQYRPVGVAGNVVNGASPSSATFRFEAPISVVPGGLTFSAASYDLLVQEPVPVPLPLR